jgi:uncharacterized protein
MTTPTAATERMDVLDVVRGVAILGILLVNIDAFTGYGFMSSVEKAALPLSGFDAAAAFLVRFLVEAKFYCLFSFLFGVGFSVFIERAARRGASTGAPHADAYAARLFKRRLAGLLIIGLAHSLLWFGDILATYAILGFALIPFVRRDDRVVVRWAVGLLLSPIALYLVLMAVATLASQPPPAADDGLPPVLATAIAGIAHGSWTDFLRGNVVFTIANALRRLVLMFFPRVLGMFLLGLWAGRRGVFADPAAHAALLRRAGAAGLGIGLPLAFVGAVMGGADVPALPGARGLAETVLQSIGAPALAIAYAAGLCLLFMWRRRMVMPLAPAGRMALTNYLGQSVAGVLIFYSPGLELFGRVSLTIALAGCVAFFALQCAASRLWLSMAAFGPAEWLWRSFTYGVMPRLLHVREQQLEHQRGVGRNRS